MFSVGPAAVTKFTAVSRQRRHTKTTWLHMPRRVIKVLMECMCLLSTSTYSSKFFSDLLSTF